MRWLASLVGATLSGSWAAATTYEVSAFYGDSACGGTTLRILIYESTNCSIASCSNDSFSNQTIFCTTNYTRDAKDPFDGSPYLLRQMFNEENCSTLYYGSAYPASNEYNGSASLQFFSDSSCMTAETDVEAVDKEALDAHTCVNSRKFYAGNVDASARSSTSSSTGSTVIDIATDGSSSGGLSTGVVVAIIVGCVVLLLTVLGIIICTRRSRAKRSESQLQGTVSLESGGTGSLEGVPRGQFGLWDDDVITTKRIPRDQIQVQKLLSRGAYGEVYSGVFNRAKVAVKMLLPGTRGNLRQVNEFLAEAKMTATMDHPRIVSFIGVAWNALADLCMVLEFVDGGDLRTLLNKYEAGRHPVGFDREKVTIALHVCHALTYLHSLSPPVIHRDLKSRNILLNHALEAKLTDFGISRERLDQTMTAGVGTLLEMAPEVMMGERYDPKADMFSFGVVLSELDMHTLPYAQAKARFHDTDGRQLADASLLQKVAMGTLQVDFSEEGPQSMTELGRACVSVEPSQRPAAAEALYKLQVILTKELA